MYNTIHAGLCLDFFLYLYFYIFLSFANLWIKNIPLSCNTTSTVFAATSYKMSATEIAIVRPISN